MKMLLFVCFIVVFFSTDYNVYASCHPYGAAGCDEVSCYCDSKSDGEVFALSACNQALAETIARYPGAIFTDCEIYTYNHVDYTNLYYVAAGFGGFCSIPTWGNPCGDYRYPASLDYTHDFGSVSQALYPQNCEAGTTQHCYTGPVGTEDVSFCKGGIKTCINGDWGPCDGQVLPQTETCDGEDNNCNGIPNDGCECQNGQAQECYDGPAGTQGIGMCKAGVKLCINGHWDGNCTNQVLPSAEQCDGKNHNCNDQVNEGCDEDDDDKDDDNDEDACPNEGSDGN